jgi:hypothetical protein
MSTIEPTKSTEETLREEIRALRELHFKVMQWGVSLLATLETALFFVRREMRDSLIELHRLAPGDQLPSLVYYIGSVALVLVACIFIYFSLAISRRTKGYTEQLKPPVIQTGIVELPLRSKLWTVSIILFTYLLIPLFDVLKKSYADFLLAHHWI